MVHVLESTLEWTKGEVIVSSGIGSHILYFALDLASAPDLQPKEKNHIEDNEKISRLNQSACREKEGG
jgi:hypothetical protein